MGFSWPLFSFFIKLQLNSKFERTATYYIFVIEKRWDIKIQSSAPLKFLKIDNTVSYQPLRFKLELGTAFILKLTVLSPKNRSVVMQR